MALYDTKKVDKFFAFSLHLLSTPSWSSIWFDDFKVVKVIVGLVLSIKVSDLLVLTKLEIKHG